MGASPTSFDQLAQDFELSFLEEGLRAEPDNLRVIEALAFAYTRIGRYEDGLRMDRRLVVALPQSELVHYNLACSQCLTGDLEGSIDSLKRAIMLGYDERDHLLADEDLHAVRGHPRFPEVLEALAAQEAEEAPRRKRQRGEQ